MNLVPMSGAEIAPEPEENEPGPVEELAAGQAFSMVLAAIGVPPGLGEILEVGHHAAEAVKEEPGGPSMEAEDESVNINPGALRPDARLRLR